MEWLLALLTQSGSAFFMNCASATHVSCMVSSSPSSIANARSLREMPLLAIAIQAPALVACENATQASNLLST